MQTKLLLGLACTALALRAPATPSSVWPLPQLATYGSTTLPLCPSFALSCPDPCPAPLPAALARYQGLLFLGGAPTATSPPPLRALCELRVAVASEAALSPQVNESYALTVPVDGAPATLAAATQWGALRGLETFLQLVAWGGPDQPGAYAITAAPVALQDWPRFSHRGVLIDTSFNFLTLPRVKEVLDAMPVLKANILHWHGVDDPAWPMESTTYPAFTAPGSGGPYASVAVYSAAQQAEVAAYAWERGVMILVELDVPGHCASWAAGSPSLVTTAPGHQTLINPIGEPGAGTGNIYDVLQGLMREFHGRLGAPGLPWFHLGGDEVTDYTAWTSNAEVVAWGNGLGVNGSDPVALRTAFTTRVQAVAAGLGLRAAFWEESFLGGYNVSQGSVVTPWVHASTAGAAAAAGHEVINYIGGYLDQWVSPARTDVDWYSATVSYGYIDSYKLLYLYDDLQGVADGSKVLGGVASAWGDNVDSSLGAAGLLFPRALAVGERLWSSALATGAVDGVDSEAFAGIGARMEHARCRLAQRGVGAAPVGIAGTYGFCWSPAWASATPAPQPPAPQAAAAADNWPPATVAVAFFAGLLVAGLGVVAGGCAGGSSSSSSAGAAGKGGAAEATAAAPVLSPAAPAPPAPAPAPRVIALDQFRGCTMLAMLFVNLYYGRSGLPHFFSHGITYMSGPDLVEPAFHFCVGYALRLVVLKRLGGGGEVPLGPQAWAARLQLFQHLLRTRVMGLICLSMFFSEGWGQFDTWAQASSGGLGGWLLAIIRNVQPYHTLLHIALITVWTYLPMTLHWRYRAAQLLATALLHATLMGTFYFQWIQSYGLDEGGYFGFLGWSLTALVGSLCHDLVVWMGERSASSRSKGSGSSSSSSASSSAPLLASSLNGSEEEEEEEGSGGLSSSSSSRQAQGVMYLLGGASGLMLVAYLLSCLGLVKGANTVCFDGTRIYFWGGFGDVKDCGLVPSYLGGWAVAPPFYVPDADTNVVTQWTMTQRAGSVTYHLFTAGTSAALFLFFYVLCEVGVALPASLLSPGALRALSALGWQQQQSGGEGGRLRLRLQAADLFGENALAVYLFSDPLGNSIGAMLPQDCPAWYFLLWGEGLYFTIATLTASYLRHHKLFLRL